MSLIQIRNWDKKPRTMLRFIKDGDIFCFQLDHKIYGFGRIMIKSLCGHIAEFFDYFSKTPEITEDIIQNSKRIISPVIIDSYGLFDKKNEGDWQIISSEKEYKPKDIEGIYFKFGDLGNMKKVDFFNNTTFTTEEDAKNYRWLSPHGDSDIKEEILPLIKKKSVE